LLILLLALRPGPGLLEGARLPVAIVVPLLALGIACRGDPACRGAATTGVVARQLWVLPAVVVPLAAMPLPAVLLPRDP